MNIGMSEAEIDMAAKISLLEFLHEVAFANFLASAPEAERDAIVAGFRDALYLTDRRQGFVTSNLQFGAAYAQIAGRLIAQGNHFFDKALARSQSIQATHGAGPS